MLQQVHARVTLQVLLLGSAVVFHEREVSVSMSEGKVKCITSNGIWENICAGIKRKTKDSDVSAEVLLILERLDQRADARMEDREGKRMLLEAEVEEKREQERRHEQRMQTLMLGFFSTPPAYTLPGRYNPSHPPSDTFQYPSHPTTSIRHMPQTPSAGQPSQSFTPLSYPLTSSLHSSTFDE